MQTQKTPIAQGSLLSSWEREMKLLRLDCRQRILISIKAVCATSTNQLYTISLKSHKNPALVSPKHCELSPWFVADLQIKTNPIFVLQREELPTYPLSASTDITGNGDGWKNKYRPLAVLGPMSGKWGSYTFNLTTGRE